MKSGAIFDKDGLMFDTERLYGKSWLIAGELLGVDVPPAFLHAISGTAGESMFRTIRHYIPAVQDPQGFWDICRTTCTKLQETELVEKQGLREILAFFHRNGVKMAVASSSDMAQIEENLNRVGIRHYFDAVVSGQEVPCGKPAPDIFLAAAAQLNLPPEDCYVFEDSFNGVRAGRAAGCFTVMIPDEIPPDDEMRHTYSACCATLTEFVQRAENGEL